LIPSAVLLPLYYKQGQYHLLFTKRTETVRVHKGQISFPGGVYEEDDGTLLNTALRECQEEIGLISEDIEVLGALDSEPTVTTSYLISPFVAHIPFPYHFRINRHEIDEIIEIPVSQFIESGFSLSTTMSAHGKSAITYIYRYQDRVIWGATARILHRFVTVFTRAMAIENKDTENTSGPDNNLNQREHNLSGEYFSRNRHNSPGQ